MSNKHIGKVLAEVAGRHVLSIVEITQRASYTQSTFYKHKMKADLDFKILYKYAIVMDYFFANELPDFTEYLRENGLNQPASGAPTYDELVEERDNLKKELAQINQDLLNTYRQLNDCRNINDQMRKEIESFNGKK